MGELNFAKIEKKWQDKWEKQKIFEVSETSKKKKFYVLEMFPYPSGDGLHMGHALNYTIGDVFARFKRMNGFNVLYPMGYDALGLPAENAAINAGEHPEDYTNKAIVNYIKQQKAIGLSYDWTRIVNTASPDFYKWDQWIFLKMFEKGLAYQKKAAVNFCSKCDSVLANEQVHDGKCWRHEDTNVEIRHLKQWFFKISDYADELYESIDKLDGWPSRTKAMQKNWIGKSHGTEIDFEIELPNNEKEKWGIFTTRPDTIYGVTFMVVSAQHSRLMELVSDKQKKEVDKFLKKLKSVSEKDIGDLKKEGVFTGSYAINPLTKEKIPVYAGNFVVADYGCGMVMAVPAHDQRDFEFAKKYGIKIKQVIFGNLTKERAHTGEGKLINSGEFNGIDSKKAIEEITKYLTKKKLGKKTVNFKLRDWLISRQRYWGTPIPIVYCDKCSGDKPIPVPEKDLPIKLPRKVKFGKGNPLLTAETWIKVKCPRCGSGNAQRETDTMDTFANSSWYFLRYCDSKNNKKIFDSKKVDYWCPVDQYIGGAEHACMHLIYVRFYTKFLRDLGLIKFNEPAVNLFHQGMLHGEGGIKMSKSKGNVINPDVVSKTYGMDTARLFLLSLAAPDKPRDWDEKGIKGSLKFVNKVFDCFENIKIGKDSKSIESKLNKTIIQVTEDIKTFNYNLAIIKIRKLFESIIEEEQVSKKTLESFLKILHIFCPHITEELWEKIGNRGFISLALWPIADEKKINEKLEQQDKMIEKLTEDIVHIKKLTGKTSKEVKVYVYVLPNEIDIYKNVEGINLFAVNDKDKYDPQGKSKKVKPGRPGIYLE